METLDQETPVAPVQIPADNAGLAIMSVLRNYGIDTIFGIPGTHNLEFYRHLAPLGIRPVTTRHEQGAGYGADGWAQQTGLPGVVITTSGPGLLNALSAAGTAYCESRPLIVLSPGVPEGSEFSDNGSLHETKDASAAAGAVMEWSRRVHSAQEAVQAVHDAFELFRYGRPRPVHIEVPLNVLESRHSCPPELLEALPLLEPVQADDGAVAAAAAGLRSAVRPVILAGGGSLHAGDNLRRLAERLQAPVITTLNGKAAIAEDHPLSLGSNIRLPRAQQLADDADVLLVIGSKVGEAEMWGGSVTPRGGVIRIDILGTQLDKNIPADIGLVGDAAAVVPQLLAELDGHRAPVADFAALRTELEEQARALSPELAAVSETIAANVAADAIIGGDSSQITYFGTSSFIPQQQPHSLLYTPAYATLGYGLPASIGAKIAAPDRQVVCVAGDGALMFAIQELITAVEQGLDLTVVCVDNGGYAEIRQNERDRGMEPVGVNLSQPNWPALADAFGGRGQRAATLAELGDALRSASADGGLQLIHVPLAEIAASL
ncbi:thiamine pyrophosphate-binding protein [Arthrobacter crystallopoietes]|uniref:thiamine pyrophosphate-binding protein n=1 Tax=Crystallibacter crystallopoietes TaxID=37928 RepID=UPI001FC9F2B8|nr:thiamine pyrophosphate-dependent enzyme [Arthrobacter crystallopoietes]